MITCYLKEGKFEEQSYQDFEEIARSVNTGRDALAAMPLDAIIKILDALGKNVLKNPEINTLPGVSYISLWLRRENLDRICKVNYSNKRYLDGFCKNETNVLMMAQPRGSYATGSRRTCRRLGSFPSSRPSFQRTAAWSRCRRSMSR